jgi:hypothetical protein
VLDPIYKYNPETFWRDAFEVLRVLGYTAAAVGAITAFTWLASMAPTAATVWSYVQPVVSAVVLVIAVPFYYIGTGLQGFLSTQFGTIFSAVFLAVVFANKVSKK